MPQVDRIIHLWDFPNKTYIKIKDPFRARLFKSVRKKIIVRNIFNFKKYENGTYSTPLKVIKKILAIFPEDMRSKLMDQKEANVEVIKIGYCGRGKPIKNVQLPIKFSLGLARIAGHLLGDGYVSTKDSDCRTCYTNQCLSLINQFKEDVFRTFGNVEPYEYYTKSGFPNGKSSKTARFPITVGFVLLKLFGPQIKDLKHVPELISKSDEKVKAVFLRALFNDESNVELTMREIQLEMSNQNIIEKIKEMLKEFGIRAGKITETKRTGHRKTSYKLRITSRYYLKRFNKLIGFDHPEKKRKLSSVLRSYKQIQYRPREIRNLIIDILRKNGSMSVDELARKLHRKSVYITQRLRRLEKEGIINSKMGETTKVFFVL